MLPKAWPQTQASFLFIATLSHCLFASIVSYFSLPRSLLISICYPQLCLLFSNHSFTLLNHFLKFLSSLVCQYTVDSTIIFSECLIATKIKTKNILKSVLSGQHYHKIGWSKILCLSRDGQECLFCVVLLWVVKYFSFQLCLQAHLHLTPSLMISCAT